MTHHDAFCFSELVENCTNRIWSLNLMNLKALFRNNVFMAILLTSCLCSSLLLSSSPAPPQELLKPWQVLLSFYYLLFTWKRSLLSLCVDWLSIAVRSFVHIYKNGSLCWYFLFREEERAMHWKKPIHKPGHLVGTLACLVLIRVIKSFIFF